MAKHAQGKRLQFNLKSAFVLLTFVCVLLAFAVTVPRLARSVLPIAVFSTLVSFALVVADRALARDGLRSPVAIGSIMLIAVSAWTTAFVLFTALMHIPGGSGPIQYASGQPWGVYFFDLRATTILLMLCSPLICVVIGVVRRSMNSPVRPGWLAAGVSSYVLAWIVVFSNSWFFPKV